MDSANALATLSNVVYKRYGMDNGGGRSYFEQFRDEFNQYDSAEIIAYQVLHFSWHSYLLDFLLSSPWLWHAMSTKDWIRELALAGSRPKCARRIDDRGYFADLAFLCRYVKVDALKVLADLPSIPTSDKLFTFSQLSVYDIIVHEFEGVDLDAEDLDGEHWVSQAELSSLRDRLLSEGLFRSFLYTEDTARSYLRSLISACESGKY